MSKISLAIVSLVIAGNASAFPMFCKGKNHTVSVNSKGTLAQVYDRDQEPVLFGKLACATIFTMEVRPEGSPVISCNTKAPVADAGLSVYVWRPHGTSKYFGTLSSQSIMGPKVLDRLKCVMAEHN